ncbi:GntP family permease [Simiduia sp. 21SJ11W-1]|uniref:GntP family permease n=1 Tax=Simiduia sp. 21SJ11W-1 TaxID=2909669 RepID=UPI0020A01C6D|nr:GntP family permease [Simiduia sp. 21SJ11W-1]UTA46507.1 GntP family permease [Simiduia sp. 21SJ11W-1]
MLSLLGLLFALGLLIYLTIKGMNLLIAAPLTAMIVALCAGLPLLPAATGDNFLHAYMNGFTNFIAAWFFMFLLGSLFGKLMEASGAADRIASDIVQWLGLKHATAAVVLACALLTYGGVSVFVVAFSAYPMAVSLFRQANLPRRFIPAVMAFGSVTFTMTSAGSPEIQNWIPIKYLGTSPYAGWEVSLVVAVAMAAMGFVWLNAMMRKALARGECFIARADDPKLQDKPLPSRFAAATPILAVLGVTFFTHEYFAQYALILALLAGCIAAWGLALKSFSGLDAIITAGTTGALLAIANTAAVVGFGSVAKASPAFALAVDSITSLPGNELIGAAIAVTVIAAMTGSASGGQSIALPELAPHYLDAGVNPEALHRVVAISSGALDSLPHNGYVVTTIRAICGETHKAAYGPMGALTVVVPVLGTILALFLFIVF